MLTFIGICSNSARMADTYPLLNNYNGYKLNTALNSEPHPTGISAVKEKWSTPKIDFKWFLRCLFYQYSTSEINKIDQLFVLLLYLTTKKVLHSSAI